MKALKTIVEESEAALKAAQEAQKAIIEKAEKEIRKAIRQNGECSHNIISSSLREVAKEVGITAANKLVDKFLLEEDWGISKQPLDAKLEF